MAKVRGGEIAGALILPLLLILAVLGSAVALGRLEPVTALLAFLAGSALVVQRRETRLNRRAMTALTADLAAVSGRLLRLEAQGNVRPAPEPRAEEFLTLSDDIGVLGGAMKTLANVVSEQEREIAGLKGRLDTPAPQPSPDPSIVPSLFRDLPSFATPAPAAEPINREALVVAALRDGTFEVEVRPVVSLPQRRAVLLDLGVRLRLPDGADLAEADILSAADRAGLATSLDEAVTEKAFALAEARPDGPAIAFRLSPATLADGQIVARICTRARTFGPGRLAAETPRRVWSDVSALTGLATLARHAVPMILESGSSPVIEPHTLARSGVRFLRLSPERLLSDPPSDDPLPAQLARAGIDVIAAPVDRESLVPELIELGVPLAQGPVLGRARALAELQSSPPSAEATPGLPGSFADEVRSLRSVVRRAG